MLQNLILRINLLLRTFQLILHSLLSLLVLLNLSIFMCQIKFHTGYMQLKSVDLLLKPLHILLIIHIFSLQLNNLPLQILDLSLRALHLRPSQHNFCVLPHDLVSKLLGLNLKKFLPQFQLLKFHFQLRYLRSLLKQLLASVLLLRSFDSQISFHCDSSFLISL